jgi:hypothetical protein
MLLYRSLIELGCFAFLDRNSVLWALSQTCAETVTVGLAHETRLAVDNLNRPLGAGGNAQPAAVAFLLVYSHYLPDRHSHSSLEMFTLILGGISAIGPAAALI